MSKRFSGKVALIIGGGRGMGRAIAASFAAEGGHVVISARTALFGEQTLADFHAEGYAASLVLGDISEREGVRQMLAEAVTQTGGLDIVVHVAADAALGKVLDMSDDTYDYMIRSNVHSIFWVAKEAAPHLAKASDVNQCIPCEMEVGEPLAFQIREEKIRGFSRPGLVQARYLVGQQVAKQARSEVSVQQPVVERVLVTPQAPIARRGAS